jgi:hypothetical protein
VGLRDSGDLRAIVVEGPGIRSLQGLERLQRVEEVRLGRTVAGDLSVRAELPGLRQLVIDRPVGELDWQALEDLSELRLLYLMVGREHAAAVAGIEYDALSALIYLRVELDDYDLGTGLRSRGWPQGLEQLVIRGLRVSDRDLSRIAAAAPNLRQFFFDAVSSEQEAMARALLPAARVESLREATGPFISQDTRDDGTVLFTLTIDLVERLRVESNYEAEYRLAEELARRAPDSARALSFDTDASAVRVVSESRDALVDVAKVIDRL